jgi:hypothetical protein
MMQPTFNRLADIMNVSRDTVNLSIAARYMDTFTVDHYASYEFPHNFTWNESDPFFRNMSFIYSVSLYLDLFKT